MDLASLRKWLKKATLENVVVINDRTDPGIYKKIPLRGSITMQGDVPIINTDTPSLCEALVYSPSHGLMLIRSLTSSHGGRRKKVTYFAEFYGAAEAIHVRDLAYRLQASRQFRVAISDMSDYQQSAVIGFAEGQIRSNHANLQPPLTIPWPA